MGGQKVSTHKIRRPKQPIVVLLALLILNALILFMFHGTARADFTVAYDLGGKNYYKPAVAENNQTGDFFVAYLDPVLCTGPSPDWEVRATLRNSSGGSKASGLAPLGACNHRALGRPAVAYSPQSDVFCIAAPTTARPSGPFFVMVGFINGDGTPVEPFNVSYILGADGYYEGSGHGSIHVVYNSLLNEFVVTAQVTESGTNRIWAQRITPSGSAIGSAVELANYGGNGIRSHGIAYAPVAGTGGRYLFVDASGHVKLLKADLDPILVTCHDDPPVCDDQYINLWYGDDEGGNREESTDFDVAYGTVEGQQRFLMVYSDGDNCIPGKGTCPDGTGVWGIFIDPNRIHYDLNTSQDIIHTYPTPFPITNIPCHGILKYAWKPRVSYSSASQAFAVVWRETPTNCPSNAENEQYSHIRGAWVENYVEDGKYGTDVGTLYGYPPQNIVIADVEPGGDCIPANPYDICNSYENPDFPDVAAVGGGTAVAVWHEYYDPPPFPPPGIDLPPNWSIRGDLFPALPPPLNDDRANATLVEIGGHEGTLARATNDGTASCGSSSASPDVWYRFQAPGAGTLLVSTCGTNDYFGEDSGVDTVLSLHSPSDGAQLTGMCNDDWPSGNYNAACLTSDGGSSRDSALSYGMANGEDVLIRVSVFGGSKIGPIFLNVAFEAAPDTDGDGYSVEDGDCNDNDNTIHPGATEVCNGVDNDCNPATPDGSGETWLGTSCDGPDSDLCKEGTFSCSGGAQVCSDNTGDTIEVCNGVDDDCDGTADDGVCDGVVVEDPAGQVDLTFGFVNQEGETTFTNENCGESPWEGFTLIPVDNPICFGIDTTVDYDPESGVMVCITYDDTGLTLEDEQKLVMFHCDDQGKCKMIPCQPTVPVDTENNVVCGCTDTLSTFGVGIAEDQDGDGIPDAMDNCPSLYDPTNACGGCLADLNGDGDVDGSDLALFMSAYGSVYGDSQYLPEADFVQNGAVDKDDLGVMAIGLGRADCPLP